MDQDRKDRVARNEVRAREMNERLGFATFVCECGDATCARVVRMPRGIYESIRADSRRFFVLPGHELHDTEDVVVRRDDWLVVRKRDDVAPIVEPSNPRA